MQMNKKKTKNKGKNKILSVAFIIINPFIIPILIFAVFISLISGITDILYVSFDNDDKIDMKKELAYYDTDYEKSRDKEEVKGFFTSVWEFVDKIFGGGEIADETDWPVVRTLYDK